VRGTLNEWVEHAPGSGGGWLSLLAARQALVASEAADATEAGGSGEADRLVVIDLPGTFYPPAAAAAGICPSRTIVVRPATRADALWAADQALRSPAVAAVWGPLERLDDRQARRLQLAAERGHTLGLWVRPPAALREPSWAEVRWYLRGLPSETADARRLAARLVRCRGGRTGGQVMLEINSAGKVHHVSHESSAAAVPLAAELARPKVAGSPARRRRA
jgi:hypothetical protein